MNFDEKQRESEEVEMALRHFRESVRSWSGDEFAKARTIAPVRRGFWSRMVQAPALGWGLASLLVISAATVPVEVHHRRQLVAEQQAALQHQKEVADKAAELQMAAASMSDEELLSHVDSDIAQATPDAMEPLAQLMSEAASK
jgi:cell division protein FtsL